MPQIQSYLIPVTFKLVYTEKVKTYIVNVNWSIEEFMEAVFEQIHLDANYFGLDIEKHEDLELIPIIKYMSYELYEFFPIYKYYNEEGKALEPSQQSFNQKFGHHYYHHPMTFYVRRKMTST